MIVFYVVYIAAMCPPLNLTGLTNPPNLSNTGMVAYKEKVVLNCSVLGKAPYLRERQCLYSFTERKYALLGDKLECGGQFKSICI